MNKNKKILIVEDEFIVANNLHLILTEAGYTIIALAASAGEARELRADHITHFLPAITAHL